MAPRAVIFGLSGTVLTDQERDFFRQSDPWAFILFARNVDNPAQLKRLCRDLRACVSRDALIFIDQEGGRVQRLRSPIWREAPAASRFGELYRVNKSAALQAIWLNFRLIAHELKTLGINANCAPVLDLPVPDADLIISDRAFADMPVPMVDMAHACMAGLTAGGVAPVIKHIPGHGRADVDSHKALPIIKASPAEMAASDYIPFQLLADAPMAMTAHVVLSAIDAQLPVTLSKKAMDELVRAELGYDGLVMTDDLDMKALHTGHSWAGDLRDLTARALAAGCDIGLHCNGDMASMEKIAAGAGRLQGRGLERAQNAQLLAGEAEEFDAKAGLAELDSLLGLCDAAA